MTLNKRTKILQSTEELFWSYVTSDFVEIEAEELEKLDMELKGQPEYELSDWRLEQFERRVQNALPHSHTGRRLKYGLIAAIIVLLSLITLSVTAFRDYSIRFLMGIDGKTGVINNVYDGIYLPSEMQVPVYVPNGFFLTNFVPFEQGGMITFENVSGDRFYLIQRSLEDAAKIDTENSEVFENQTINGQKAILTIKHNGSSQALYWNTPDYSYELVSSISLKEMLKIAESIPQE